ncbi:hypothetical protein [Aneurinibacillus sp. REN35]|uniref:hypothetical protein n=1 Tax=Aneurinibacillus sp. REN35 TaxID=3237286 RepID=UPI003529A2D6
MLGMFSLVFIIIGIVGIIILIISGGLFYLAIKKSAALTTIFSMVLFVAAIYIIHYALNSYVELQNDPFIRYFS